MTPREAVEILIHATNRAAFNPLEIAGIKTAAEILLNLTAPPEAPKPTEKLKPKTQ
jgi:hypothetical protein